MLPIFNSKMALVHACTILTYGLLFEVWLVQNFSPCLPHSLTLKNSVIEVFDDI